MKEPPNFYEPNAEKVILGCILLDRSNLRRAFRHGLIASWMLPKNYEILTEMLECGDALDLVTLSMRLSRKGRLDAVGGAGYIASATDGISGTENELIEAVKCVRNKRQIRDLMLQAQNTLDAASTAGANPDEITRQARQSLENIPSSTDSTRTLFMTASDFMESRRPEIDWIVKGVIQRGANGFIAGEPKAGKSYISADLAIALATGNSWLGFEIPQAVRVALISREDENMHNLWVNTREQSARFRLDDSASLSPMIEAVREHKAEVAIIDVMNILHGAEENDATEMRKVMDSLTHFHAETGADLCVLHHFNKALGGTLTRRLRGSSAIAGWAEYIIAVEHEKPKPRIVSFEVKAAEPPAPLQVTIESEGIIAFLNSFPAEIGNASRLRM